MVASLRHVETQEELDRYLNRRYVFPVEVSSLAPLPLRGAYKQLRALEKKGFRFSLRELLHVVGSKTAALPSSYQDACVRTAHALLRSIDFNQPHFAFRSGIPSDFQTPRSQEMGVGISCLIGTKVLKVPIDDLEPIPGVGMRFDYSGRRKGLTCMIESKGTKYRYNQNEQIEHGLEKKEEHHIAGDQYDVELICSTFVGTASSKPRILLGDPTMPLSEWMRSTQAAKFFRLRHYARVMQFIGAPTLARLLYLDSDDLKNFEIKVDRTESYSTALVPQDVITIDNAAYVGSYFNSTFPENRQRRTPESLVAEVDARVQIFQGIRRDRLKQIQAGSAEDLNVVGPMFGRIRRTADGLLAHILQDGSAQVFELRG